MEQGLSSGVFRVGFHFPGESLILSKFNPYLQFWARKWNFEGKGHHFVKVFRKILLFFTYRFHSRKSAF